MKRPIAALALLVFLAGGLATGTSAPALRCKARASMPCCSSGHSMGEACCMSRAAACPGTDLSGACAPAPLASPASPERLCLAVTCGAIAGPSSDQWTLTALESLGPSAVLELQTPPPRG